MLQSVYATKLGMTQAWTASGKRLPVTKCQAKTMRVVAVRDVAVATDSHLKSERKTVKQVQIGLGEKKLEKMHKPLRAQLQAQGFSTGVATVKSTYLSDNNQELTSGQTITLGDVFHVGDVVQVQGSSKGRGFAGVVKRHGFAGGPKTHGQSDRHRAPGSIGQRTTPGRVHKNKRMAGHMGDENVTVSNLIIIHIDQQSGEIWLSGPVPGATTSLLKITRTGKTKAIALDAQASHLPQPAEVTVVSEPTADAGEPTQSAAVPQAEESVTEA